MAVTFYIKLFRTGADMHNGTLMSLFLLVAETKNGVSKIKSSAQNLTSMITRISFWNFIWKVFILELALYCHYGDKK